MTHLEIRSAFNRIRAELEALPKVKGQGSKLSELESVMANLEFLEIDLLCDVDGEEKSETP